MPIKVLFAVDRDLCQATPGELLVPNPIFVEDDDNDFFVGVNSRRPARFGTVGLADETLESLIQKDVRGVIGSQDDDPIDPERAEDIQTLVDGIADCAIGAIIGCQYVEEAESVEWELFEEMP